MGEHTPNQPISNNSEPILYSLLCCPHHAQLGLAALSLVLSTACHSWALFSHPMLFRTFGGATCTTEVVHAQFLGRAWVKEQGLL